MSEVSELQHWGIKGMKWGIRRYQNPDGTLTEAGKKKYRYQLPDGSLTDEGKKNYMKAARKGKLDPKKLSNADLDMINSRFVKENNYAKNVQSYKESTFSYKLKKAAIDRVKGNGGGGGKKGGGGSGIGKMLAAPIKKAFEDAFKNSSGGNKKDDWAYKDDDERDAIKAVDYKRYQNNGHRFVETFKSEKPSKKDLERWKETGSRFVADNRSSEDILRERHKPQPKKREKSWEEKRSESERAARRREREAEERASKSGIIITHSGTTHYVVCRTDNNDELVHFGIKGQKWGVRRYENEDGTLTEAGKMRYAKSEAAVQKYKPAKERIKKVAKSAMIGASAGGAVGVGVAGGLVAAHIANERRRSFLDRMINGSMTIEPSLVSSFVAKSVLAGAVGGATISAVKQGYQAAKVKRGQNFIAKHQEAYNRTYGINN